MKKKIYLEHLELINLGQEQAPYERQQKGNQEESH